MQNNTNVLLINKNDKSTYSKKFWLMMCVFYTLFVVRNILNVSFPVVLYLGWVAAMALAFDDREIKALVISFIPLSPGFQIKYAIFVCIIILVIKYYNRFRFNSIALLLTMLLLWELGHFGIGDPSIVEFLRGFAELIFIAVVVCLPSKRKISISEISRVLAISSTVAFLILLFVTIRSSGESIFELMQKGFRFGESMLLEESFVFVYNANGLGIICNFAIAGLLLNIYDRSANVFDYLMIVFLIFIGLLTVSRTFVLCLVGMVVLYVLLRRRNFLSKILTVFAFAIAAVIMFSVVAKYFPSIIENYINRFGEEDITNGRSYLFDFYNEFILSSIDKLFFGIGIQDISINAGEIMGEVVGVPHNGYQQLIVAWGIPGLVLMALFVYKIIKQAKENKKIPFLYYLPFVFLMVNILAGQFVTSSEKMLSLVFTFEILNNYGYDIEDASDG